jgi:DNA-binding NarL/FixJ family response regulator
LKKTDPLMHFLVLTIYDDDSRIFDSLCAGACGYLTKKTPPAKLLGAIEDVAAGGAVMSPDIARKVMDAFRSVPAHKQEQSLLTPHEIRILKLLMDGHNRQSAAECLDVSAHTVSFHVRQIYEKLQVHTRSAAVAKALRLRLLD